MLTENKYKALLIYPEIPPTYWSFKYILSFIGKRAAFPPLGLLTIASLFKDNYDVKLIDMNVSSLSKTDLEKCDIVFISSMIVQKESFDKVVRMCKSMGKTVVAGGPYPSSSYIEIEGVDHFILNEAEDTLEEFLDDFSNNRAKKFYIAEKKADIHKTPVPRFDLINFNSYSTMALQYSRGCPFNCEFCDIIEMYGRIPRTKTPHQFINEMESLMEAGYKGALFIVDDNFIGNKKNVKNLLKEIIYWQKKNNYPFIFFTEASINLAGDEELLRLMKVAGFQMVFIGIETPLEEALLLTKKRQNKAGELLDSIYKIQKAGMEVTGGFIVGFDNEPQNIFDMQINFIQKSGIVMAMVGLLTALPNTQLYKRLKKEKRLLKTSTGNNTHDLQLNFTPTMPLNVLLDGYKRIIANVYKPKYYFERCLVLLKNMGSHKTPTGFISSSMVLMSIKAFFYSIFLQTFSWYGLYYLKYLYKSLFLRPDLFPKAFKMALIGHHFFKITNEILATDNFKIYLDQVSAKIQKYLKKITSTNLDDVLINFFTFKKIIFSKLQKRYKKLHEDFQGYTDGSMETLQANFKDYLEQLIQALREQTSKINANNKDKYIKDIKKFQKKITVIVRKKYRRYHKNFRFYFKDTFKNFNAQLDKIILEYENHSYNI
jgi:radical SAM superfamily enzyme YgiQ (UPF0313 family)